MSSYCLTLQKDGQDVSRFHVGTSPVTIGRGTESDIVLPDKVISRQHVRLQVVDGRLFVEDLGSTNGVVVNGARVKRGAVACGDVLHVGKYTVLVEQEQAKAHLSDTGAFIPPERAKGLVERLVGAERSAHLALLYKASQLLGSRFDVGALLDKILALIFDAVPARRGFIITRFNAVEPPQIRASRSRDGDTENLPLSMTLIDYVFTNQTAILTCDASHDERFDGSKSIYSYGIQGAMAVPLYGHAGIIGAIYVDAEGAEDPFTEKDLELLTVIGRIVGVAVDNARLYEESVQRERLAAIGEAIASIGHCMKNILTGLKASEEFVDGAVERRDWGWAQSGWKTLRSSLNRFEKLVLDLLAFSHDAHPRCSEVSPAKLIEEVFAVVRGRAEKAKVSLSVGLHEGVVLYCDEQQMYRVLLNLVSNAVDACGSKGGSVTVSAWSNKFGSYVEVRDTGIGIPPGNLSRLGQAFFSTKGSTGTGLGLACSYRLIEGHGGKIVVDSVEGQGTTFTVFLPGKAAAPFDPKTTAPIDFLRSRDSE